MKKILVLAVLLMSVKNVFAEDWKNLKIWRTTTTSTAVTDVVVATGTIFLYEIAVTSGQAGSFVRFFNSRSAANKLSTSAVYDTGLSDRVYRPLAVLTTGFVFTTGGTSSINMLWDWMDEIPRGQEKRGRY